MKFSRRAKEATVFVVFLGGKLFWVTNLLCNSNQLWPHINLLLFSAIHVMYYKIQANENLVPKHERQELFYVRWLKKQFPALKGIGIQED